MRKTLVLSTFMLLLGAPAAMAGLDLTWRACNTAGGDSTASFACSDADSALTLYGAFQVEDSILRFVGLEVYLDLQVGSGELSPFWHLEPGGCNRTGLAFSDAMPEVGCEGAVNPWGDQGADAFGGIAAVGGEVSGKGNLRLVCGVTRSADNSIDLAPGINYFAFQLRFFTDNAKEAGGHCAGCRAPVVILWSSASLVSVPPRPLASDPWPAPILLAGSGRRSSCVRLNGAKAGACAAVPVPNATWDSLKALGR